MNNNLPHVLQALTKTQVLKGAVMSGACGLVLFILGLAAIVSIGALGTISGTGMWAIAIGLGCVLLMIPSALLLGIGIQYLRLSIVSVYSLIVGKPVYGSTVVVDVSRNCPDSK
jgi:hypothetical protein